MKQLLWLRAPERRVRVQAGITWRDLQDVLDPHDLSVRTMQSFSNFTVGGAVSVNCHGRYVGHGPIGHSVRALQLVLADGRVVEASRQENPELLARRDRRLRRDRRDHRGRARPRRQHADGAAHRERCRWPSYPKFFADKVLARPRQRDAQRRPAAAALRCAGGDHLAPHRQAADATEPPGAARPDLHPEAPGAVGADRAAAGRRACASRRPSVARRIRPEVAWRNHEASLDVAQLEPLSRASLDLRARRVLRPAAATSSPSCARWARILRRHRVAAVNVSIRHSPADTLSLLPWAREEVFSFVLFYRQGLDQPAQRGGRRMDARARRRDPASTRGATTCPISCTPRREQFERAYPEVAQLRQLKSRVDPQGRFSNSLWQKYL